jgi:hypothetical protein
VDWNSDGTSDLITGERRGFLHVLIRHDTTLTGFWQYRLLDSTVLCVGVNSQPTVADWNGDGMKDVLIGEEGGSVRFYPNRTSDTWPMFQDFTYVEAGGAPINLLRVNPYVVDLNQDGLLDLVCGLEWGFVLFFRNVGTRTAPQLLPAETLRTLAGAPITPSTPPSYNSRCGFGDWNNDGILDFLISGHLGRIELYLGTTLTGISEASPPAVAGSRATTPTIVRGHLPIGSSLTANGLRLGIFDSNGREVMDMANPKSEIRNPKSVDVSRLAPGVYFVRSRDSGQRSVATKVVIW